MTGSDFGQMTSSSVRGAAEEETTLIERVYATKQWLRANYRRPLRALLLGRKQLDYLRTFAQVNEVDSAMEGIQLFGVPVYAIDADDWYEPVYDDESQGTLDVQQRITLASLRARGIAL